MKKIFLIFAVTLMLIPNTVFGQSTTPANSKIPTSENLEKINFKVDQLKDKVASRVAELNLVEKRGVVGVVQSATDTEIRVNDLNDKTRIIDVDELTKFSSNNNRSFGISDIKKGTKISAIGLYNKESQRLLARFVNEISIPLFLNGVISQKDDKEFTITLSTEDENNYTIDIEKITKAFSFTDTKLETSGFTKLETLQNALVIGFPDPKNKDRITATKIIVFPNLPQNPRIAIEVENETSPALSPTPETEE